MSRELPIGFKVPMVQAILAGRKSQTRRILTPQPPRGDHYGRDIMDWSLSGIYQDDENEGTNRWWLDVQTDVDDNSHDEFKVKYAVGDRLYVREQWRTFITFDKVTPENQPINLLNGRSGVGIIYPAGGGMAVCNTSPRRWLYGDLPEIDRVHDYGKVRQGMHLPRWGSRLTLTVTDVRIERLRDITEEDALAEGVIEENVIIGATCAGGSHREINGDRYWGGHEPDGDEGRESAIEAYLDLWEHINGPGSVEKNPWVIAYTFTHEIRNIDDAGSP